MKNILSISSALLLLITTIITVSSCSKTDNLPSAQSLKIYVANEDGESISVIDGSTNRVLHDIDISNGPGNMAMAHNVQAAPDGKTIWVTNNPMVTGSTCEVIVIDPKTDSITHRIPVGVDMHLAHVVLDNQSQYAYVTATEADAIIRIDVRTFTVKNIIQLSHGHSPHGLRYSNGFLYVACIDSKSMTIINTFTDQVTDVAIGGMGIQSAVSPDGRFAFVSVYDKKELVRYEIATGTITHIPLPAGSQGPVQLYPSPDGRYLYICDQGLLLDRPSSDKVYALDIGSNSVAETIRTGNAAHGVVFSRDGYSAYVTNSSDNTVSVINIATRKVMYTIPVGPNPNGIAYWYGTGGMP